jgi:hypothetical protein
MAPAKLALPVLMIVAEIMPDTKRGGSIWQSSRPVNGGTLKGSS